MSCNKEMVTYVLFFPLINGYFTVIKNEGYMLKICVHEMIRCWK